MNTPTTRREFYERLIGHQIAGKYTVTGLLGFGGMGAVYEAIQHPIERRVAIKVIPATSDPTASSRFVREAQTMSGLTHPNTATIHDFGQTPEGLLFLVMEHIDGVTLSDVIEREAPLPPKRVVRIITQVCRSLGEAHRMGVIHRDVKPDNIMLVHLGGEPDHVKVLDFGIAKALHGPQDIKLTSEGKIVGTPRYMSPEQVLEAQVDHRADIYALGCILFELLCGAPPFAQSNTTALMISHVQDTPPTFAERLSDAQRRAIPAGMEGVVQRCIAKEPDARPQSMEALAEELEQALIKHSAEAQAPARTSQRGPLVALALVMLAILGAGGWWLVQTSSAPPQTLATPVTAPKPTASSPHPIRPPQLAPAAPAAHAPAPPEPARTPDPEPPSEVTPTAETPTAPTRKPRRRAPTAHARAAAHAPEPTPEPAPKTPPAHEPAPTPEVKPTPTPEVKPEPTPAPKPEPEPERKPEPEHKPEHKPEARPAKKPTIPSVF